jgi:CheY-like chemotaxis protein
MRTRTARDGRPPLILVVDDNLDAREMYCMYLRHEGFECLEAADGAEALRLAREHLPVVVLMDATMPGLDGWQAIEQLRAEPDLQGIAVVMLTAHAFDEHRRRAATVGADAFLAKPVLPDDLARQIRELLRLT